MASIIPGFEYDIFISYRHNDNRADGWVTQFVQSLRYELEATVKDRLSIYFDANANDGLSDVADVDRSLGDKIKALILVPIISQTYCDTRSFAWQHEFIRFRELAEADPYAMHVRLANGNYVSRMLPVRIHDLEAEDQALLETELRGHLRSIDFVYAQGGVNRPLLPSDPPMGGTTYRNQINKVANAVKELVKSLKWMHQNPGQVVPLSAAPGPGHTHTPPTAPPQTAQWAEAPAPPRPATPSPPAPGYHVAAQGMAPATEKRPRVYLAWTSKDIAARRDDLAMVLQKAGIEVLPATDAPSGDDEFRARVREAIPRADCSIHILSHQYGRRFEDDDAVSFPRFQYQEALAHHAQDTGYKSFVWYVPEEDQKVAADQQEFLTDIRNGLTESILFSTVPNPVQIVEDIRAMLTKDEAPLLPTKDTDIFFIYNELDMDDAERITEDISQHVPVEVLAIEAESEQMYREFSVQQIPKSHLAVVYFKHTASWALPFIKQVWKLVGGASSGTPILLLADADPATNRMHKFKAPGVTTQVVEAHAMPPLVKEALGMLTPPLNN